MSSIVCLETSKQSKPENFLWWLLFKRRKKKKEKGPLIKKRSRHECSDVNADVTHTIPRSASYLSLFTFSFQLNNNSHDESHFFECLTLNVAKDTLCNNAILSL